MKTCGSCGMPAPSSTLVCGFCADMFPAVAPVAYRLAPTAAGYRWDSEDRPVAEARWEGGLWHLFDAGTASRALTLVAVEADADLRVALLDGMLRTTASVVVDPSSLPRRSSPSRRALGFVRDRRDRNLLAVYGDGPTGVHLVDRQDDVVALASPMAGRQGGLDVLVTSEREPVASAVSLGGVLLSLELARMGQLRAVG